MNKFSHIKAFVNVSGRKDFKFVAMTCSGKCLGYFKNSNEAQKYLATDGQAHI